MGLRLQIKHCGYVCQWVTSLSVIVYDFSQIDFEEEAAKVKCSLPLILIQGTRNLDIREAKCEVRRLTCHFAGCILCF